MIPEGPLNKMVPLTEDHGGGGGGGGCTGNPVSSRTKSSIMASHQPFSIHYNSNSKTSRPTHEIKQTHWAYYHTPNLFLTTQPK